MFVNKHFIISGAYISKGQRCSNVKPLSSVFRSYLEQRNLGIKKYLFYTIFLPIKKFYIFSIFRLNFLSYIPPFFGSIFIRVLYDFLTHKKFLYSSIFRLNFRSYIPPFFGSVFVLIFHHFLTQFSFLYSPTLRLNFNSYIPPFFATFYQFFSPKE